MEHHGEHFNPKNGQDMHLPCWHEFSKKGRTLDWIQDSARNVLPSASATPIFALKAATYTHDENPVDMSWLKMFSRQMLKEIFLCFDSQRPYTVAMQGKNKNKKYLWNRPCLLYLTWQYDSQWEYLIQAEGDPASFNQWVCNTECQCRKQECFQVDQCWQVGCSVPFFSESVCIGT